MPQRQKKKAKGLPSRTGKRHETRARYYATRYLRNKLHRILRRNGDDAARAWAAAHQADGVLRSILGQRSAA